MDQFPAIPRLLLPDNFELPVPILELPQAEIPRIEPIFIPQTVQPGSIQDLEPPALTLPPLEDLELIPEEEDSPEEISEESEETEETEETEDEEKDAKTDTQPTPPTLTLPPIQNTLIEVPFEPIIDEPSLPVLIEETEEIESEPEPKELEGVTTIEIIGLPIPIPKPEILVAAGATATVSVAATLASTSILKKVTGLMKPLVKKIFNTAAKLRGKKPRPTWARERLEQRRNRRQKTEN